ncbi:MAG: hypothetical protein ACRD20_09465 [Terriglobales bacterium]
MSRVALRTFGFRAGALATVVVLPLLCLAAKDFVMPHAEPAKTYPARDEHPMEAVAVAVDPYDLAEKTNIFSVHYSEIGFLPIFVVVTNDGNQPVELSGMKAQLVTANRAKLSPAGQEDIARRLTRPAANTNRYPIPFPTKKVKGGLNKQAIEEIQNSQFDAKAVEPHSSQSGFLFFDVSDISVPLAGAHFYLTGVRDAKGNELMYFEIALEKYLSAPAKSK